MMMCFGKQVNAASISNSSLIFVLNRLFENTGITYKIIDNIIYLKKENQLQK